MTARVPQDYSTIQAAVDHVGPGGTVWIDPGTYVEQVDIRDAGMNIRGATGDPEDVTVYSFDIRGTWDTLIEAVTLRNMNLVHTDDVQLVDAVLDRAVLDIDTGPVSFDNCDFGRTRLELERGTTCTIRNSRFDGRSFVGDGGAIWLDALTTLVVEGCVFHEAQASGDGGAIYCGSGSAATISRCTFVRNWASGAGGAIAAADADVLVENSILAGSVQGEGIACIGDDSNVTVTHSILYGNSHGDAVCGTDGGNISVDPGLCNSFDVDGLGLCADSPALAASPDNPWGEDIGALGQECDCVVSVEPTSWGRLKGMYR